MYAFVTPIFHAYTLHTTHYWLTELASLVWREKNAQASRVLSRSPQPTKLPDTMPQSGEPNQSCPPSSTEQSVTLGSGAGQYETHVAAPCTSTG